MQLTSREFGDVSIIDACGDLHVSSAGELWKMIHALSVAGRQQIVLNFRGVHSLSDSAIEPLVAVAREVARRGGEIKLAGVENCSTEPLNISRLYTVFNITEDDATAVCDFAMPRSQFV